MSEDPTTAQIVFFGTDAFSVPSLIRIIAEGWHVAGVITKPDSLTGRGRLLTQPAVKRVALSKNIPVFQPENLSAIEPEIEQLRAKIGIVVAYGKLIPPSMIRIFPKGLLNVHASLLPRYRGASPIEAAILAGDNETGATLMHLDAGLDTGPTYDVAKLQLSGTETREDLYERLAELGADLLSNNLSAIIESRVVAIPQNESEAIGVGRINKSDGRIDWTKPAVVLERQIRAYLGWPGSFTELDGRTVTITAAHVDATRTKSLHPGSHFIIESGELAFSTGERILVIDRLKPAGRREMPSRDFLAGRSLKSSN
jgi:methionyl-tRNA formyltransferase